MGAANVIRRPQGHSAAGIIMSMKTYNDSIGNRTRNIHACSAVLQLATPPHAADRRVQRTKILQILFKNWAALEVEFGKQIMNFTGKVNVKFALEQTTKAQRGSRGIAILFP
jgi:hypothetical protein